MQTYTAKDARNNFSELISQASVANARILITKNGKSAAAMVPAADLELLAELERIIDVVEAQEALDEGAKTGFISLEDLKKKLNL